MNTEWNKAPRFLTDFNGLKCSLVIGNTEWGVFSERYSYQGCKWTTRQRPLDEHGEPLDCWGHGTPFATKREAVDHIERMAQAV
ncbi:MAG: hypothetical protein ACYSWU_22230 [Planctomycetota bacterium]|jgi:hypothetical protein